MSNNEPGTYTKKKYIAIGQDDWNKFNKILIRFPEAEVALCAEAFKIERLESGLVSVQGTPTEIFVRRY